VTAAALAAAEEVPMGRLEDALRAGHFMQAENLLDDAFAAMEAVLEGGPTVRRDVTAAAGEDSLGAVLSDAFIAGTQASSICLDDLDVPPAPAAPAATPLPKETPFPRTVEAAAEMRASIDLMVEDLQARKINAKVPSLNPNTPLGRERISKVFTAMHSASEALDRVVARGLKFGRRRIKLRFKALEKTSTYANASQDGVITVNIKSPGWRDRQTLSSTIRQNANEGWFSAGDADAMIVHEMGHVFHVWEINDRKLWPLGIRMPLEPAESVIARKVSRYATTNNKEFVAETFSGMISGKRYPSDVMDLYAKFSGAPVNP
jgi:hypothetical protein